MAYDSVLYTESFASAWTEQQHEWIELLLHPGIVRNTWRANPPDSHVVILNSVPTPDQVTSIFFSRTEEDTYLTARK